MKTDITTKAGERTHLFKPDSTGMICRKCGKRSSKHGNDQAELLEACRKMLDYLKFAKGATVADAEVYASVTLKPAIVKAEGVPSAASSQK